MGLGIGIGPLAGVIEGGEPDEVKWVRRDLKKLNRALKRHKLPEHVEPETLPKLPYRGYAAGFPYSYLHHLRRAVAYARHAPKKFAKIDRTRDPMEDPLIDDELSIHMDSHVVCHSDYEGYYVPIDFADVIFGETDADIPGGMLGSSQRVLAELVQTAPLIGVKLTRGKLSDKEAKALRGGPAGHPYQIERIAWFTFYEATRLSVEHKTVIVFG